MTQQYVAGELSLLLAHLRSAATDQEAAREIDNFRQEAETMPLATLGSVAVRAMALADGMCWASIARGDVTGFSRLAEVSARLHEFGVCAGLLRDQITTTYR
ncbi:hypothetical protein ACIBL3_21975 [Kribbella sp. NPDC050124]|uniref:hypothetical protein n=1 Tax=Kribbella sp. NPDC050124 TaxID=3364114 RepID=UPI00378C2BCA